MSSPSVSRYDIVTLFPEMFGLYDSAGGISGVGGVVNRARVNGLIELHFWNPRDFVTDGERVDSKSYGGQGMVLRAEPVAEAIASAIKAGQDEGWHSPNVYAMSFGGSPLNHNLVAKLGGQSWKLLICGRYEGIDQRVINLCVDEEISVGDYVLSGGELAAQIVIDSVTRTQPGVLGHEKSCLDGDPDRPQIGGPVYTKPQVWRGLEVPKVLTQGHHSQIENWRQKENQIENQKENSH